MATKGKELSELGSILSVSANTANIDGSLIVSNSVTIGNSTVNATFTATSINANTVGGNTASDLRSYSDTVAATAYSNAATYAGTAAGTAYSNATSYADTVAGTAYTNATSFATTAAGTAYSNAATYADNKAANAYSNAIAYSANATNISSGTLTANVLPTSGVTAATYGNSSQIPVITVDATGRITSATTNAVAGVTSFTYTEANNTFAISTGDGSTFAANIGTANATHTGVLKVLDSVANTNTTIAAAVSSVKTAYDAAIAANTNAASAYSNAVSYAGTIAATAYTNATSYAATIAGTAYSNGVTYTDNKAANAYSNATTFASNASNISSGTLAEPRLPFRMDQNVRTNDSVSFGSVSITGNLTVTGTTVTINTTNLTVDDNMIYLNEGTGGANANPDLGFAGAYNDGTYRHAGFFRDASDGVWKVFDQYLPEPDASPFIDTANASFRIANFQANVVTAASLSGNGASVTSVDAATVGGNTAGTLRSYSDTVAATAYTNAVSSASSSAATAYSNAVSYFTTNYTASDVLTKIKTVDGTGSGLDADTVDGYDASSFALKTDPEFTNDITTSSGQGRFGGWYAGTGYTGAAFEVGISAGEAYALAYNRGTSSYLNMNFAATDFQFAGESSGFAHINTSFRAPIFYDSANTSFYVDPASTSNLSALTVNGNLQLGSSGVIRDSAGEWVLGKQSSNIQIGSTAVTNGILFESASASTFTYRSNTIWHAGNDGAGSGLDADLLDGSHGSYYDQRVYNSTSNYLGGYYVGSGAEKPNDTIFGAGKLKIAMLNSSNLGFGGSWNDVLWMSTYTGGDVKQSWAIVGDKYSDNMYISRQAYDSASWGTGHKLWHSGNDGSGSGLDADTLDGSGWASGQNVSFGEIRGTDGAFGNQGILASGYPLTVYDNQRYMLGMRNSGADANYVWLAHDTWNSTSALVLHFDSVGDRFTFNEGGIGSAAGDFRAPIFYDSGSTNYYVDPASGSVLGGNLSLYLGIGTGDNVRDGLRTYDTTSMAAGVGGQLVLGYKYTSAGDYTEGAIIKMFKEDGTSGNYGSGLRFQVRDHAENLETRLWLYPSGYLQTDQSMRAPIFYDTANTGYFVDPASSSYLNVLTTAGGLQAPYIGINNTDSTNGYGLSLYGGSTGGQPTYGIMFQGTGTFGTYGAVSADWATYFTMNSTSGRGWIFRNVSTGNVAAISNSGEMTLGSHLELGNNFGMPNIEWSASSGSSGMVIFYLPGTTSNYGMVHMVFDIYEYDSPRVATVIIGGHNWSTSWYNNACNVIGYTDKQVRLGVKDGRFCVIFGTSGSSWSYGTVRLRKIHNGSFYNNIMNMTGDWSVVQTTTESFTNVTGDLRGLRTPTNFEVDNIGYAYGSFRAPIFYDTANTSYYLDPASTSVLNSVYIGTVSTDRVQGSDGTFLYRVGSGSGTTRHINLADSTSDPSSVGSGTGITAGSRSDNNPYYLIYVKSPYNNGYSTYSRLSVGWHTGLELGASASYGGTRIMNDSPGMSTTELMSIGKGDQNVRVANILYAGDVRASIFYDQDDTTSRWTGQSLVLRGGDPTIYFRDTDHYVAMLHCNSNLFYLLRANSADTESYTTAGTNGNWPVYWNLTNNDQYAGRDIYGYTFYARDSTGYYLDPDSTSYLYHLVLSGNSYFRPSTWIQMDGSYGMYWPNTNGAHLEGNTLSSYGSIAIRGSRNGWRGIHFYDGGSTPHLMFDGSSNGGIYYESGGRWAQYYHYGNVCQSINTSTSSSSYGLYVSGSIYSSSNIVAASDARLKENVITVESALDKVNALRGVYYNRIDDEEKKRKIGVIAQEVEPVIPEVVTHDKENDRFGVDYGNLAGLFIEAFKEQTKIINDLKQKIEELESKLNK